LDPTKILIINKTRLLLNCCGIFDVLTFDPTSSNPMAAMAHYQQEDLIALGKIVLGTKNPLENRPLRNLAYCSFNIYIYIYIYFSALACNSFLAIQRENLQTSMEIVTSTYSSDMRNLIMYLLTNPNRVKTVNDLMPMIGK
jgi:PAB-dependent poly(A)-specific ribonuclease subunit 3